MINREIDVSSANMSTLLRSVKPLCRQSRIQFLYASYSAQPGSKEHLESLVNDKKVVVFMKGNPAEPKCGFSNAVVQILNFHGVTDYSSHDVLADENIRQGN